MKIRLQSNVLHATPPCCYWVFQDFLYGVEQQEQEYRDELANEVIEVEEKGKPWLSGLAYRCRVHGNTYWHYVKRCQLSKDHPDYTALETVELDGGKAMAIIARSWLTALEEYIRNRYFNEHKEYGKEKMRLSFTGMWSPREYNFLHDSCDFTLSISKKELNRIFRYCLKENRKDFSLYLYQQHTSYDGYRSYMSNEVEDYDEYWVSWKHGKEHDKFKHLVWACLDFWLFVLPGNGMVEKRFEFGIDAFDKILWDHVYKSMDNGAFYEAMTYKEDETAPA
jgi:hypothetical protein